MIKRSDLLELSKIAITEYRKVRDEYHDVSRALMINNQGLIELVEYLLKKISKIEKRCSKCGCNCQRKE